MTAFATAADGLRIAYACEGEGPPVLLLHGFASSAEQNWVSTGWMRTLVAAGFRTVALDFRGHGASDKPRDPEAYGANMLLDVYAVMEAADAPSAAVMGYSMGGMYGIHLMLEAPERVRRLIVAGAGERYFKEPLSYRLIAEALEAEDEASIADSVGRRFRRFAEQKGKDRLALAACMRARTRRATPEELGRSTREVLVVCGDSDDIAGPPEPLAAAFAHGRAVLLPGRDHMNAVGDAGFKREAVAFLGGTAAPPWSRSAI